MAVLIEARPLPGNRVLLGVRCQLDAVAAPAVRARIEELVQRGQVEIVCDLSQVRTVDSSGLSALVSGRRAARERGGFLRLVGVNPQVAAAFQRTMLDRVFEVHPSVEAALA